jgi:iron complex transport system substrate-binding protein
MTRWLAGVALALGLVAGVGIRTTPLSAQRAATEQAPQRIVSLVPATTEMLFDMGAGSTIVGVGSYDRFPPEVAKLPRLGGLLDPSIEQLLALKPDLAVVYGTQADLQRQLERGRIPIFSYATTDLSQVASTMRALGARIGRASDGDAAARRVEARLAAVRARVAGRPRPRTLLVFGREPGTLRGINASGGFGFMHDLLELAGGADALADVKQASVAMSSEMVLARAPDVIIELHYSDEWPASRIEAERRIWASLSSVPAVKTNRVHMLSGDEFVVPGPRVPLAAERLARVLHPEAYQ